MVSEIMVCANNGDDVKDMKEQKQYKRVLTIAGSDSGGGAGIQADLKTISACGCFGMSAITAVTAQNTRGVVDIHPIPITTIAAQIEAVLDDIGATAIKIGMLHSSEVIDCVASRLNKYACKHVILDPVMVATSGDSLIEEDAVLAMKERLFPMVDLITPNIPEAEILYGQKIRTKDDMLQAAEQLGKEFSVSVLMKAGHMESEELVDILWDATVNKPFTFRNSKIITRNSHGTGCSLSSAIASFVAQGLTLHEAIGKAETYLHGALKSGSKYRVGSGHGPVHHFYKFW